MPNYKEMYYALFNKITDVIGELQEIQMLTENLYIESDEKIIDMNLLENIKNDETFKDGDK